MANDSSNIKQADTRNMPKSIKHDDLTLHRELKANVTLVGAGRNGKDVIPEIFAYTTKNNKVVFHMYTPEMLGREKLAGGKTSIVFPNGITLTDCPIIDSRGGVGYVWTGLDLR